MNHILTYLCVFWRQCWLTHWDNEWQGRHLGNWSYWRTRTLDIWMICVLLPQSRSERRQKDQRAATVWPPLPQEPSCRQKDKQSVDGPHLRPCYSPPKMSPERETWIEAPREPFAVAVAIEVGVAMKAASMFAHCRARTHLLKKNRNRTAERRKIPSLSALIEFVERWSIKDHT